MDSASGSRCHTVEACDPASLPPFQQVTSSSDRLGEAGGTWQVEGQLVRVMQLTTSLLNMCPYVSPTYTRTHTAAGSDEAGGAIAN